MLSQHGLLTQSGQMHYSDNVKLPGRIERQRPDPQPTSPVAPLSLFFDPGT
jgi:hypothetical protein